MDKFLMYFLGTNDYNLVLAGFILSLIISIYPMILSKKLDFKGVVLKGLSVIIFMRFYPFIMSFIGLAISIEDTMIAALVAGFFSKKIIDKFYNEGNNQINEL